MLDSISNRKLMLVLTALTIAGCLMTAGVMVALDRLLSADDGVAIGMPVAVGQSMSRSGSRGYRSSGA
jgi:hypothetical protein